MKLSIELDNKNYLGKIIYIDTFFKHPNADKLKCCNVDGFNIICGIDYNPGVYVYFPTGSCLNPKFLSYNNLYKHKNLNKDLKKGMFENNGKVKILKIRGIVSEGFILPVINLKNFINYISGKHYSIPTNIEFDSFVYENNKFWIVKKYVSKQQITNISHKCPKIKSKWNKVIENQFRFHYSTNLIKKYPNIIHPNDYIHISEKVYGTSAVSAYVLCKKSLSWKEKIAKWLTGESFNKYDYLYSSRSIIKNKYYNKYKNKGYYNCDVWQYADAIIRPKLSKGYSVYYEIIGFLPNGKYIQKNYDYGCVPPESEKLYTYNRNFKIKVYRVTITNSDGIVYELSPLEVQLWCNKVGLDPVTQYYYGKACDLYQILENDDWNIKFIEQLSVDVNFHMECLSPSCINKVPHAGIVIRLDNGITEAFKLKCFLFLDKSQKEDDIDIDLE